MEMKVVKLMKKNKDYILRIIQFVLNVFTWIIGFEMFITLIFLVVENNEFIIHLNSKHHFIYLFVITISKVIGPLSWDIMINGSLAILLLKISEKFMLSFIFEKNS